MTPVPYPLAESSAQTIQARSGKALPEITLDALRRGDLSPADLATHPDTLRLQAQVAEEHGYRQLTANLRRAAELALIPEERILAIYEALRPYRTNAETLAALALELRERWNAPENAKLVLEAADAYRKHQLVK